MAMIRTAAIAGKMTKKVIASVVMLVAALHTLQCRDERRSLGKITQELASAPDVRNGVGAVQNGRRCVLRDCVCNVCKSGAAQDFKVWMVVTRGSIGLRARLCGGVTHKINWSMR
jgi:hypothetical protein